MTKILSDCCCNHLGDRRIMESMIKAAASVGVDIVKFQSFKAEKLRKDWPNYENAYRYYKQHELSESDHFFLMEKCKENGIEFLTTVTDLETVYFLAYELGLKQVKIASPDANNWELIDKCLENFEKVIISTGLHTEDEMLKLLYNVRERKYWRYNQTSILHCVSVYPAKSEILELNILKSYLGCGPRTFNISGHLYGFSDHTIGLDASKLAISLGADYVERHFTLSRYLPGKDHFISSTPEEFRELCEWRDKVQVMMGSGVRELSPEELTNREKYHRRFWGA